MIKQIVMLAVVVSTGSCISGGDLPSGDTGTDAGMGELIFGEAVRVVEDMRASHHVGTRADGDVVEEIDKSGFNVRIIHPESGVKHLDCEYGNLEDSYKLREGEYELGIESHDVQDFEWEGTEGGGVHYSLSHPFTIVAGETTTLPELECKVSNILVSIDFSDKMRELMGDDCTVSVKVGSLDPVVYDVDETRRGCFRAEASENSLTWTFNGTIAGKEYVDIRDFVLDAKAGEHHTLHFDIEKGKGESGGFEITADVDSYDVNLNLNVGEEVVDPFPPTGIPPTIEGDGFDIDRRMAINIDDAEEARVVVNISTEAPIEELGVMISTTNTNFGEVLAGMGLGERFDLANLDTEMEAVLGGLGLPVGDAVAGQTELVFDISSFVPLMAGFYDAFGADFDADFALEVVDAAGGSTSKTIQLHFTDQPVDNTPPVSITGDGIDEPVNITAAQAGSIPVVINIAAPKGIAELLVEIDTTNPGFGEAATALGVLNLTEPGESQGLLDSVGLPYGDAVKGQTSLVFPITSFVSMIFATAGGDPDFTVDFKITVTDTEGAGNTKTVKLHLTQE